MPQHFTNHHPFDSNNNIRKLYSNFDGSNMINFGTHFGRTDPKSNGLYGDHTATATGGIEFRAHNNEEESGVTSPPLWNTSPPKSPPTETTPLQSQVYSHHHYRLLSPTSRAQAIARGKEEMMEMVKTMPESSYELSLKDLVDHNSKIHGGAEPTTTTTQTQTQAAEQDYDSTKGGTNTKKKKKNTDKRRMSRSGSMNNNGGPFLLKMFVPISLGLNKKKKSSSTGTCAKVSPRPVEGDKFADKDWWKRRLSGIGETECSGSGSSGSSDSNRSRNKGEILPGCWDFFKNNKSKTKKQKGGLF